MIERCTDYRIIKRAIGILPVISREIIYLNDDGNIWTFEKNTGVYRVHANMLTKKGKDAIESARAAFKWVFDNTDAKIIKAEVPIENKQSRMLVRHCMTYTHKDKNQHYYEVSNV